MLTSSGCTAMGPVNGPSPAMPLSLMGLTVFSLAGLLARERIAQAERQAKRRREAQEGR